MSPWSKFLLVFCALFLVGVAVYVVRFSRPASSSPKLPPPPLTIYQVAPTKYRLTTLDNHIVELGTQRHSPPKPFLTLHKWGADATLTLTIPHNVVSEDPKQENGKLIYTTEEGYQVEFLPRTPDTHPSPPFATASAGFTLNDQGGIEFNTILPSAPPLTSFLTLSLPPAWIFSTSRRCPKKITTPILLVPLPPAPIPKAILPLSARNRSLGHMRSIIPDPAAIFLR